jgi:DnaK suppressor protein
MKYAGRSGEWTRKGRRRPKDERAEALAYNLHERRRSIQEELDTLSRRLREEERPDTGDEGDQAVYGFNRELGSARLDQLSQTLRQIDNALARHAEGRYGRCVACSGHILVARLRSLPFALYCRDCQALAEERRAMLQPHRFRHMLEIAA